MLLHTPGKHACVLEGSDNHMSWNAQGEETPHISTKRKEREKAWRAGEVSFMGLSREHGTHSHIIQ